ncbi:MULTISPECIES: flagellar assembly protein FliH [Gammaproteobacteria]|uniref:flagellar assembly protein FliH n=1 Tax=Gammaproteobacteria TaxID=1236 RepID=UPI000DD09017|nr:MULTISPECIES: flagellar assembly protein FliH [Gammaproteobacteria]RTE85459.1 flagellar assembly protein FliH [Aliidiomarina sp. B3213]TCZ89426.1 flagellar assembly protein FliH [Lysobacter sp. N42]
MSDESAKAWDLPDITEDKSESEERSNALNMRMPWKYEPPEADEDSDLAESDEFQGVSAEALEELREAARQEGFAEGKKEGLEAGHKEGFEAGYADGEARGKEAGEEQAQAQLEKIQSDLTEQWEQRIESLRQPLEQVDEALETQLLHLTKALAAAVCWNEVKQNETIILEAMRRGLNELGMTSQRVEIYVHENDMHVIDATWDEKTRNEKNWFVYTDNSISQGGCKIQTPLVEIDATMETRMQEVFASLLKGHTPQKQAAGDSDESQSED